MAHLRLLGNHRTTEEERRVIPPPPVNVGLLGCGTVGSAVARKLLDDPALVERAAGAPVRLTRIAVRDPARPRRVRLPPGILTSDALAVACDLDVDVVVEAIGGTDPARDLVEAAVGDGKSVVTANKELIATHGPRLLAAAEAKGVDLFFEAAVCGAIPIVRSLRDALPATRLRRITGIVNGTANFVLTRMAEHGATFDDALHEARVRGYAEADPAADVTGRDAAAKAVVLATLVTGSAPVVTRVGGIDAATGAGPHTKLVAEIDLTARPPCVEVGLRDLPPGHPLAAVTGADNALLVETADGQELFFRGPGAGGEATAVAVLGDVVQAARQRAVRPVCA
ncbi:MAG: homoserine dehydrogenase [Actinomycetota bacterium]|nr:homoserine dehydrogenase [Actinomycetota bacterium]